MSGSGAKPFRIWDSATLFTVYQDVMQMQSLIEEACTSDKPQSPEDLPESLVPTDMLYDILSCFSAMYEKILETDLAIYSTSKLIKDKIQ
jgi:hypothetical protein